MSDFVHLHNHTVHSYFDAFGTPAQVVKSMKEKGFKAAAITDHGNVDGCIAFYFAAKKEGIKPILGVEAYLCTEHRAPKSPVNPTWHVTLLAKSAVGYQSLCRLMTLAWKEGYHHRPRIDFNQLKNSKDLIVLSGCPNSSIYSSESGLKRLEWFQDWLENDFYLELMPVPNPKEYSGLAHKAYQRAKFLGIKPVLTADCHYPKKEDAEIQDLILAINTKSFHSDPNCMRMDKIFWQRNIAELQEHAKKFMPWLVETPRLFSKSVQSTLEIANKVNIEFPKNIDVKFDCGKKTAYQTLLSKVMQGKRNRKLEWTETYEERLRKELALIKEKKFSDYFLIVADVVNWAKQSGILVGPARGSAAGSLVCYLLRITEIDPLRYDLLFERFIDHTRYDLPDIDLDFEDRYRDHIISYLKSKYKNVGVLSAWSRWAAKSCLLDTARVYRIPREEINQITPFIIQRSGGDARASFTLADTLEEFQQAKDLIKKYPQLAKAQHLESQIRQKTRHAAGIVISAKPIEEIASSYSDDCISIDGKDVKSLGALKLDILGINTLTIIAKCLEAIKQRRHTTINIYELWLEDPRVMEGFRARRLAGIFQYEGDAMKMVNRQVPAQCFNDLTVTNAASRPGPLHCGGTTMYNRRKNGIEPASYAHPLLEEITKNTLGVFMYQEQVIRALRDIGKMSWEDTSMARQTMSARKGTETFNQLYEKFKTGAMSNGIQEEVVQDIWGKLCTFGSWAFNLAHAVSYTTLAYWTMWLKVYYPEEFYWASIAFTTNDERKEQLIKEWKRFGGKIENVDISKSLKHCSLEGKGIRMGWSDVRGVGEKVAERIVSNAPYKNAYDFVSRAKPAPSLQKTLEDIGIIKRIQPDLFESERAINKNLLIQHCPWLFNLDLAKYRNGSCTKLEDVEATQQRQQLTVVGLIREINLRDINELSASRGRSDFQRIEKDVKFANITIEDETDIFMITFSRKVYAKWQPMIWKDGGVGNIVQCSGILFPEVRKMYSNDLRILGRIQ